MIYGICNLLHIGTCYLLLIIFSRILIGSIINNPLRWLCWRNGCGRSYKYKYDLSRHVRKECGVEPQHKCGICSKAFKRNDHLISHMSRHFIYKQQQ